jgi:DNA invertase Pin-like site-specific DNA recombinase
MSGAKANRPDLNRLIADARARKFDCLLVWKLDRFGRKRLTNPVLQSTVQHVPGA